MSSSLAHYQQSLKFSKKSIPNSQTNTECQIIFLTGVMMTIANILNKGLV